LVSGFSNILENFLIHNSVESDSIRKKEYLCEQLKNKKLDKFFNTEVEDLKKLIDNSGMDSKSFYFAKLRLADEELSLKKFELQTDKKAGKIKDLAVSALHLDIYMRLYIYHILIQNGIMGEEEFSDYGEENLEKLYGEIEKNKNELKSREPRIYLSYLTLKLITSKNLEKSFSEMENYIDNNRMLLKTGDIEFSLYSIVSYIVREISNGKYENTALALQVFKRVEKKGFFNKLNEINYYTYIFILLLILNEKDMEYAEEFIWRYYPKLKLYKEDSINLAVANLRFVQGKYSEAKAHINKINLKTYEFYLLTNSLLLRIFYEEESFKFIYPNVDSFKHFLKRNKHIPEIQRESFGLFLKYLTRLTSLKTKSRKDFFKIDNELSNEKNFFGKEWIEEKVKILNTET
jgi:hypothetical protein